MNTSEERKQKRVQNVEDLENFLREFKERFPTREACMSALWKLFRMCEKQCTRCGKQLKVEVERSVSCPACHKTNWVTAGTALHKVLRPDVWLAIVCLQGAGIPFSSARLATMLNAASATVRAARHKIALATTRWMMEENPDIVCSGRMVEVFDRHSMETPFHQHPRSEQQAMEKRASERESFREGMQDTSIEKAETRSPLRADDLPGINNSQDSPLNADGDTVEPRQQVLKLLAKGPIHFEALAAETGLDVGTLSSLLMILEIEGKVKGKPGGVFVLGSEDSKRSQEKLSPNLQHFARDFIEYIKTYLHGISRKYVQLYMASYWYHLSRENFEAMRLTSEWMSRGYISSEEIQSYVSPLDTIVGTLKLSVLREC